ncbi:MAG TPA: hypothetical protein VFL67_08060, partial [Mycobacterium sp.]|nr:hypothetical protein [Mycobacterium sp.]
RIDKSSWEPDQLAKQEEQVKELLRKLNLPTDRNARAMVDTWIRQYNGQPGMAKGQEDIGEQVTYDDFMESIGHIIENVNAGDSPLISGEVPLIHATHLRLIYNANRSAAAAWQPRRNRGRKQSFVRSWDDWVAATIGQVLDSDDRFESMFLVDVNGFWQSYNGVSILTESMGVSPVTAINAKLKSTAINGDLMDMQSFSTGDNSLTATPIVLETMRSTLDALTGRETPRFSGAAAETTYASRKAERARRRAAWRAGKKLVRQQEQSFKDYVKDGTVYLSNSNRANVFARNLANVSLINRMVNPGLWVSGLIEVPVRGWFEFLTGVATGNQLGRSGKVVTALGNTAVAQAVGYQPMFTQEQEDLLNQLAKTLGADPRWMADLYNELLYQTVPQKLDGAGKVTTGLENVAGNVAMWFSDPRFKMQAPAMARNYLKSVWEYFAQTDNNITVEQFVELMQRDPLWLKKQFMDSTDGAMNPHRLGISRVAQIRTVKSTLIAKPITSGISGLMGSSSATANVAGHLLHIPFMFVNFNANLLTTMTGMSGFDQALAMFFSGRKKPAILTKVGLSKSTSERWDFTDIIETVDLHQTFIRSGMTVSTIATLATMFGNLGLSGEDEEEKRRRRLAKNLNVPYLFDPREPQNSFTYADALFLDNVPILGDIFRDPETGRAAVKPSWIMQQFTAPIMGVSRFFQTGDLRDVAHGFFAAYSAMPRSLTSIWQQADSLAGALAEQAQESNGVDTIETRGMVSQLFLNVVGVYERALLENATVNMWYQAKDEYDRDPFTIPQVNDDGSIKRDEQTGLPIPTTSLQSYVDPETGETLQSYAKRGGLEAQLLNYAKNNAVFATLMSLTTGGGDSPYLRGNMAVKERKIELAPTDKTHAEAIVMAAAIGGGQKFRLSERDITFLLKAQIEANGERWVQADVEAQAAKIYAANT